jgi:hypothetical protein
MGEPKNPPNLNLFSAKPRTGAMAAIPPLPFDPNAVILEVFDNILGSGTYATVHEGLYHGCDRQHVPPLRCAVKVFDDTRHGGGARAFAKRESDVLNHLWGKGVLAKDSPRHRPRIVQPMHFPPLLCTVNGKPPPVGVRATSGLAARTESAEAPCAPRDGALCAPRDGLFFLPLALAEGGTLEEALTPPLGGLGGGGDAEGRGGGASPAEALPLEAIAETMHSLGLGLKYCHEKGVFHYDLKPAQVLLSAQFPASLATGSPISIPTAIWCDFAASREFTTAAYAPDLGAPDAGAQVPHLLRPPPPHRKRRCAMCKIEDAEGRCKDCSGGVAYCNEECQRAHWEEHSCVLPSPTLTPFFPLHPRPDTPSPPPPPTPSFPVSARSAMLVEGGVKFRSTRTSALKLRATGTRAVRRGNECARGRRDTT